MSNLFEHHAGSVSSGGRLAAVLVLAVSLFPSGASGNPPGWQLHTRSIVACDPAASECGIAVVSFPTGVAALVPAGEPGVIVAKQMTPSLSLGRAIIKQIKLGADAPTALATALARDPFPEWRQLGVAALSPNAPSGVTVASYSGAASLPQYCDLTGATHAVQAALQTASDVCVVMAGAFEQTTGSLPRRLLAALQAGSGTSSDQRGEYSASIKVYSDSSLLALVDYTLLSANASVDCSAAWEADLAFGLNSYLSWYTFGHPDDLVQLTPERTKAILKVLHQLGFYTGTVAGRWSDEAEAALIEFGTLNTFLPKATVVVGGVRYIDAPYAEYIVTGFERDVLRPKGSPPV